MQQLPILQADNVEKIKFDSSLCKEPEKLFYYKFNIIPWQKLNDTTFFMVEDTSRDVNRWVEAHYGIDYVLIKVDSEQILNLLNSHFGISEFASNYLYYKNPNFSAKSIKLSSIFFASFFIVTSILTLTEKYTYFALMLIFIIGCSSYLFKFIATIFNLCETSNQKVDYSKLNEEDFPIYTILLPAFKESAVIEQLIESIESLDYPKSKLDVKLQVESDDQETLAAIEKYTLPQYFEVIKVPHSLPRTKAKSCNYAMSFARGKYAVIYDADDKPDPLQLKKALIEFNKGDDKLACVQAKLNYYNCDYNFLTKSFSLEYMNWFQYLLPGFQKMNMPMPLGGSSNHFSVKILKKVFFWDAYSVTEDADLGLRLAQMGYKTRMIDSETLEESPIAVFAWIKQRARWIKGYMQTYIVHLKNIKSLYKHTGFKGILLLNLFVGSAAFIFFTTPFLLLSLVLTKVLNELFLYYFLVVYVTNLILLVIAVKQQKMPFYFYIVSIFFPVYSLLHSVAAFLALLEFILYPERWNKTQWFMESKPVAIWLFLCCIMVILMVGIGGFTRLSKAGLSITEWKPITGTLPPLSEQDWLQEKLKYEATPEYKALNYGMSIEEFRAIYLIEYVHRLVARLTGLVFVLPFIYFTLRRKISKKVVIRLLIVLLFGALQAFAGWYMVKSGLVAKPHVSHYRLALHLLLALVIFALLSYQFFDYQPASRTQLHEHCDIRVTFTKKDVIPVRDTEMTGFQSTNSSIYYTILILILIVIQIIFGAFVAGLNAGLIYNTFPLMDGQIVPEDLFFLHPIWLNIFENRVTVQFIHRALALLILALVVILTVKNASVKPVYIMLLSVIIQIILGVITLLLHIPIAIAIAHQVFSFILFGSSLYFLCYLRKQS